MFTVISVRPGSNALKTGVVHILALLLFFAGSVTAVSANDPAFRSGPGGLRIKDIQTGQGQPAATGQVATIHFVGWIDEQGTRGRELYNTRAEGEPVSFVIGTDGVMAGWNEGVLGMRPGGKRMLLVPPGMAYGQRGVEGIVPENSSLMFRIELIGLRDAEP